MRMDRRTGGRTDTNLIAAFRNFTNAPENESKGLGRPIGFHEFQAFTISTKSEHKSGKVVTPTHRPSLPPTRYSWYSFLLAA